MISETYINLKLGFGMASKINSDLLDQEAKKRKVDTAKILQDEVISKVKEPTEAEALAFYHENKSQLSGEFNALKEQIMNYL